MTHERELLLGALELHARLKTMCQELGWNGYELEIVNILKAAIEGGRHISIVEGSSPAKIPNYP